MLFSKICLSLRFHNQSGYFEKWRIIFFLILFFSLLASVSISWAEDLNFDPSFVCPNFVKNIDQECNKLSRENCRAVLEKCENYFQSKAEDYKTEISKIKQKEKTLEGELKILTQKIESLGYQIYKNNLIVKDLNFQIEDTQKSIDKTTLEINRIKQRLNNLLQLRYEQERKSFMEVFWTESSLSNFFNDLVASETINQEVQELFKNVKDLKSSLETQKDLMVKEKKELEETQILVNLQKKEEEETRNYKKELLKKTRGEEVLYQKYLTESKNKAQQIRKKIFELAQVAEGESLTLESAYRLAKEISQLTGIRPAFLLGLLKIESDIGKNVGQCNCGGKPFCRYPKVSWQRVMTQNHWSYFKEIVQELGLDIDTTPVSCAVNGGKIQWGGAMGPAQMMPTTWLKAGYKKRVEDILGVQPSNPWRIKDAFLAAALYLSDFGATSQKEVNEISAARAYLCGTTKLTWTCEIAGGRSYVYQIMEQASKFQKYIDQGVFD